MLPSIRSYLQIPCERSVLTSNMQSQNLISFIKVVCTNSFCFRDGMFFFYLCFKMGTFGLIFRKISVFAIIFRMVCLCFQECLCLCFQEEVYLNWCITYIRIDYFYDSMCRCFHDGVLLYFHRLVSVSVDRAMCVCVL